MDTLQHRLGLHVGATHLAKLAIELSADIHVLGEHIGDTTPSGRARWSVDGMSARRLMRAMRAEMDELEALLEGREPEIKPAPRAA